MAPDKPLDPAVLSRLTQVSAMNKLEKMALRVSVGYFSQVTRLTTVKEVLSVQLLQKIESGCFIFYFILMQIWLSSVHSLKYFLCVSSNMFRI